jgi:galactokinase
LRECSLEKLESAKPILSTTEYHRSLHVVQEIERTQLAIQACQEFNWEELGRLLIASHASLRDLYEVSCPELDALVSLTQRMNGVYGCRMTGGGFGGSVIAVVESGQAPAIENAIKAEYGRQTGISPDIFRTRPATGGIELSLCMNSDDA